MIEDLHWEELNYVIHQLLHCSITHLVLVENLELLKLPVDAKSTIQRDFELELVVVLLNICPICLVLVFLAHVAAPLWRGRLAF